jgi:outer membrane protein insertion porin family
MMLTDRAEKRTVQKQGRKRQYTAIALSILGLASGSCLLPAENVFAFEPFKIQDIRVEGLQRISEGTVFNYLPVHVGDEMSNKQTQEIIEELYVTGFFSDVQVYKQANTLIIKLSERPSIGKFELKGAKDLKDENLKQITKSHGMIEGNTYDVAALETLKSEMQRFYFANGKYGVKIDSEVKEESRNRVSIKVTVKEGSVARIRSINIIGNSAFTDSQLRGQMFLTTPNAISWFTKADQYNKQHFMQDLEKIKNYYIDRGYANFQITSTQVSISPNRQDIFLTISLNEGNRYKISGYEFTGQPLFEEKELNKSLILKPGEVYSRLMITETINRLQGKYGEEGYAFAKINPILDFDEATKSIKVKFYIELGQRVYASRITFKGNTKTKDSVIRRELIQHEGGWVSTKKVEDSKKVLDRTGYFSNVEVETQPVPGRPDHVDVLYTVEEAAAGSVNGGVGYSDVDGLIFNAALNNRNVLGSGNSADVNLNLSQAYKTFNISYNDPFYTLDGVSRGFNLYYSRADLSNTTDISSYSTDALGANVTYGIPLSMHNRLSFGAGYQNTYIHANGFDPHQYDVGINLPSNRVPVEIRQFLDGKNDFNEFSINMSLMHNSLDRYIFPQNGFRHGLSIQATVPGSDLQYYKLTYSAQYYKYISHGFIFTAMGSTGYGDGYGHGDGKRDGLPFYKNFYVGGSKTVRGYKESSLGPKDSLGKPFGGNFMVNGTAALIVPSFFVPESKSVRTALFVDGGQAYYTYDKKHSVEQYSTENTTMENEYTASRNPQGLRYSAGVSITWMSPLSPIIFSFSVPLNEKEGDKLKGFSFNFGTVF